MGSSLVAKRLRCTLTWSPRSVSIVHHRTSLAFVAAAGPAVFVSTSICQTSQRRNCCIFSKPLPGLDERHGCLPRAPVPSVLFQLPAVRLKAMRLSQLFKTSARAKRKARMLDAGACFSKLKPVDKMRPQADVYRSHINVRAGNASS